MKPREVNTKREANGKASTGTQYYAAFVVSLGGFSYGTSVGWSGTTEIQILQELSLTIDEVTWIGSMLLIGGASIMLPLPFIMAHLGRKTLMFLAVVPLIAAWTVICIASQIKAAQTAVVLFCVGQFFAGLCEAVYCVIVPIYICEIAQKEIRGKLTVLFELLMTCGILYSYVIGSFASVLWLSVACGLIPVIFGLLLLTIPETPQYLLMSSNTNKSKAASSLQWFRGADYDITTEFDEIEKGVYEFKCKPGSFKEHIKEPGAKKALLIGIGVMMCKVGCGLDAVEFHLDIIFEMTGLTFTINDAMMFIGVLQIIATSLATLVVDRAGRRLTLLISLAVLGVFHVALGTFFVISDNYSISPETVSWIPLVFIGILYLANSFGPGPISWLIAGEIFPDSIKNVSVSLCSFVNWFVGYPFALSFVYLVDYLGKGGPFFVYAVLCALGVVFVGLIVVETKGKSSWEIQQLLAGEQNVNIGTYM